MLNWLRSIYNGGKGVLTDIEKWLAGAINAVYSYFGGLINQIWSGISVLSNSLDSFVKWVENGISDLYHLAQWIIDVGIPRIVNWAENELAKLASYLAQLRDWAISELKSLGNWALGELNKLAQWVLKNVWDPLWNAVSGVIRWVQKEGAYVYYLITHPDKLAAILGQYVLANAMSLGRKFAKPFVKWLVHNMVREVPSIASVIEDIIASLF